MSRTGPADADEGAPPGEVLVALHGVSKTFTDVVMAQDADDPDDFIEEDDDDDDRDTLGGTVLVDVDLEVARGRTLGVVGPHGCGKTTLARVITGTLEPDAGTVVVRGTVAPPPEGLIRLMDPNEGADYNARLLRALLRTHRELTPEEVAAAYELAGMKGRETQPFGLLGRHGALAIIVALILHLRPDLYVFDPAPKIADADVRARILEVLRERVADGAGAIFTSAGTAGLPIDVDDIIDLGPADVPPEPGPARDGADHAHGDATLVGPGEGRGAPRRPPGKDIVISDELHALELSGVTVDLAADPPVLTVVIDVLVQRVELYVGCVVHLPGREKLKIRSPTFVFASGPHEVSASLGGIEGGEQAASLEIGVGVEDAAQRLILMWPDWLEVPPGSGLDTGLDRGQQPGWRVLEGKSLRRDRGTRRGRA